MRISLNSFEQSIDETILKRGFNYWKDGCVSEPEEISPGEWEFIVQGTEDYTVKIHLNNEEITDFTCTCPYDLGPVCKHVVAALFEMQKDALKIEKKKVGNKEKNPHLVSKRKTVADQLNHVLSKLSREEIASFIREYAGKDRYFRQLFLSKHSHLNEDQSRKFYAQQVNAIVKSVSGRDGFIEYGHTSGLVNPVSDMLESAGKMSQSGNPLTAVFIYEAVAEEMLHAMENADDSNGDIGGCIDESFELLKEIANDNPEEPVRLELFSYAVECFSKRTFSGWDWDLHALEIAAMVAMSDEEITTVYSVMGKGNFSDYTEEHINQIKLGLIAKTKGSEEADEFIRKNIHFSSFRKLLLERAFLANQFDEVKRIANDGIRYDTDKSLPGLVNEWYRWLLKTAQAEGDRENIVRHARHLFFNSHHEMEYYELLKRAVNRDQWKIFVDLIIKELNNNRWPPVHVLADIFVKEERWGELLNIIQKNISLSTLEHYDGHLAKHFPSEIKTLYESGIKDYLAQNTGRNHYKTACRYIRRMKKVAGLGSADALISGLKHQYIQRRALLEELAEV